VFALEVFDGKLIAGGRFTRAGSEGALYIAQWDGNTWSPMGPGTDEAVHVLYVFDGSLIVGGRFRQVAGIESPHIARWDGTTWHPIGSGLGTGYSGQEISCITEYQNELIAGRSVRPQATKPVAHCSLERG
jgi:hypothetical protein